MANAHISANAKSSPLSTPGNRGHIVGREDDAASAPVLLEMLDLARARDRGHLQLNRDESRHELARRLLFREPGCVPEAAAVGFAAFVGEPPRIVAKARWTSPSRAVTWS
jgi:hypothetical protein